MGYSFGNLFFIVMVEIIGDLEMVAIVCLKVLVVWGKVLLVILDDVKLWVEMEDGCYVEGEFNIFEV